MRLLRHIHSSGRYDRPMRALVLALESYFYRGADLVTLTEQANDRHRAALHAWAEERGYTVVQGHGPGTDCAIAARTALWPVLRSWSVKLTSHEQRRGPGGPPPAHAITALLRKNGSTKLLLVSVAHLPSHVEGFWFKTGPFKGRSYRVFVWLDARARWWLHVRKLRKQYGCKVIMVADWNLNLRRRVFRALLRSLHPGLRLTWQHFDHGTHGGRLIDATLTDARIVHAARLIDDDASSDHWPYLDVVAV